jgi:hypothetical protein
MAYLCLRWTPNIQNKYFMFQSSIFTLFVLNRGWKLERLQIMIFEYVCVTLNAVELKTGFERWINRNYINDVGFFHLSYLITLMAYLCSKWTPNVQIKCFMLDWSFHTQFVLHRDWKRDSLQIMIIVDVCASWVIIELKSRFETWIIRNDVNGVSKFNLSYLITLRAYQCSQRTPDIQIKYFNFHWSIYRLFVLNTGWKRDSLQIMIFVNVCSTLSMFQQKRVVKPEYH